MDMYQKRKMRQEKKNSESNQESFSKVSISWDIPTYGKLLYKKGVSVK